MRQGNAMRQRVATHGAVAQHGQLAEEAVVVRVLRAGERGRGAGKVSEQVVCFGVGEAAEN